MEDTFPNDWNLQSNINHYFTRNTNIAIKTHNYCHEIIRWSTFLILQIHMNKSDLE